jgi:hypothetical protein
MAISYPLTPPTTPGNQRIAFKPCTVVTQAASVFTGQQQIFAWPGQWWEAEITLPPMKDAQAEPWLAFFLSLNGAEGTFWLGDSVLKAPQGTAAGSWTVGAAASAGTTTLPITGGSGTFSAGDWVQVGNYLHKVMKVNAGSLDVFPRLPISYASGAALTITAAKGQFRLMDVVSWGVGDAKIFDGLVFKARSVL